MILFKNQGSARAPLKLRNLRVGSVPSSFLFSSDKWRYFASQDYWNGISMSLLPKTLEKYWGREVCRQCSADSKLKLNWTTRTELIIGYYEHTRLYRLPRMTIRSTSTVQQSTAVTHPHQFRMRASFTCTPDLGATHHKSYTHQL